jgi:hypothetical protein
MHKCLTRSRESVAMRSFTPVVAALAGILAPLMAVAAASGEALKPSTTINEISLRKAPRTDSEILAVIPKGTTLAAGDCHGGWCRVSWNGQAGYATDRDLGVAERWPNAPAIARSGDDVPSQRTDVTFPRREEGKETGHEDSGPEHRWILEVGTAGEWPFNGERPNFGGTIAAEVEPIENWLELEYGLSALAAAGHTEVSSDLLFKKPFRLSPGVEFMVGGGPSFSRTLDGPERGDSWSAELALDWMFWPTKNVGWFVEPTWNINPRNGQQSAAVSIGVLIGFPK